MASKEQAHPLPLLELDRIERRPSSYLFVPPAKLLVYQIVEKRQASIASKPRRTRLVGCLKGIALAILLYHYSAIHRSCCCFNFIQSSSIFSLHNH